MERYELENSREFKAAKELEHARTTMGGMRKGSPLQLPHSTGPCNRPYSEVWLK